MKQMGNLSKKEKGKGEDKRSLKYCSRSLNRVKVKTQEPYGETHTKGTGKLA